MSRGVPTALVLCALVLGAASAPAGDAPAGAAAPPPAPPGAAAADSPDRPVPLPDTPLATELRRACAEFRAELKRLTDARREARNPAAARELEAQIAALKATDELRALEIQARHARAAGLTARADELDQLLASLRAAMPAAATSAAGQ